MATAPGAVSREELEEYAAAASEAEASLNAAKADANKTAVDLKYTTVTAPISGRIDRAMVSKGTLLTGGTGAGTLLTKIVDEQPMYVYFDVDERSLLRYMRERSKSRDTAPGSLSDQGIDCFVRLADEKDYPHKGRLDFIETEVNSGTGTARLRGVFANKDRELASGMFVRIRIPASQPYQALLIPERRWPPIRTSNTFTLWGPTAWPIAAASSLRAARRNANHQVRLASWRPGDCQRIATSSARTKSGGCRGAHESCRKLDCWPDCELTA